MFTVLALGVYSTTTAAVLYRSFLQVVAPSGGAKLIGFYKFLNEKILEKQQFNPLWQNRIQTKRWEENLSIFCFGTVTFG